MCVKAIVSYSIMPPKVTTPSRKQKTPPPCKDLELEFSRRMLSLFTTFYDTTPSTEEIMTFPPVKPREQPTPSKAKSPSSRVTGFNSAIWDLRLKKAHEKALQEKQTVSDDIEAKAREIERMLNDENEGDLTDVFLPEKAPRPEVPTYLQNIEEDRKAFERERKPKPTGLNIAEAERQFSIRLARHKQKAKERKEKMVNRRKGFERSHREFLNSLPKPRPPPNDEKVLERTLAAYRERKEGTPRRSGDVSRESQKTPTSKRSPATRTPTSSKRDEQYYVED